ncbi:hypothetical protein [Alteromonas sp. 14N.309.X.WAT.G.H12]|uniref:hypothetical protein n=1 Tax=Alteromonas sp. 14N.309.X.WAT.G.H12 TaxID=3120824 RepID=UPI002FD21425
MLLLKRLTRQKRIEPVQEEIQTDPNFVVPPPEIILGISPHEKKPSAQVEESLKNRLNKPGCNKCESCGVTISQEMRHSLFSRGHWYNVCSMCYYPTSLDKIPFYEEGDIIYFPNMSQARLNAFLRGLWVVQFFANTDPGNDEMLDVAETLSDLERTFEHIVKVTVNVAKSPSETGIFASTMHLLQDDEYNQRHKYFGGFRWLPSKDMYEKEIPFWAQNDYKNLHHEQMSGNITKFVKEYIPDFRIKE